MARRTIEYFVVPCITTEVLVEIWLNLWYAETHDGNQALSDYWDTDLLFTGKLSLAILLRAIAR